jgi:hypothetical protein
MGYFTFFVLFALIICYEAHAQNEDSVTVSLQPIIVTATRMPTDARLVNRSSKQQM